MGNAGKHVNGTACRFDYVPGPSPRPVLRCAVHPKCPREVTLWRDGLLEELSEKGLLAGAALADGNRYGGRS